MERFLIGWNLEEGDEHEDNRLTTRKGQKGRVIEVLLGTVSS